MTNLSRWAPLGALLLGLGCNCGEFYAAQESAYCDAVRLESPAAELQTVAIPDHLHCLWANHGERGPADGIACCGGCLLPDAGPCSIDCTSALFTEGEQREVSLGTGDLECVAWIQGGKVKAVWTVLW